MLDGGGGQSGKQAMPPMTIPATSTAISQTGTAAGCRQGLTECSGQCTDLLTDSRNCGKCGNTCPAKESSCINGSCVCSGGLTLCAWCQYVEIFPDEMNRKGFERRKICTLSCHDLSSDKYNCGACRNMCPPGGSVCRNGQCSPCPKGTVFCLGACRDFMTDPFNCGGCGIVCRGGHDCRDGKCQETCVNNLVLCNGNCTNRETDE